MNALLLAATCGVGYLAGVTVSTELAQWSARRIQRRVGKERADLREAEAFIADIRATHESGCE